MLILSRHENESIRGIGVKPLQIKGGQVRMRGAAPDSVKIMRNELIDDAG